MENFLYLKDIEAGNHKRAFHTEDMDVMMMECKTFHQTDNHVGCNKFETLYNEVYFKFPRALIRQVFSECLRCAQSQPLKTKDKQVHITAQAPMERLMIDLIDMSCYKEVANGYAWILSVIDVYSKFSWAFPLQRKTGKEVAENLENLF